MLKKLFSIFHQTAASQEDLLHPDELALRDSILQQLSSDEQRFVRYPAHPAGYPAFIDSETLLKQQTKLYGKLLSG